VGVGWGGMEVAKEVVCVGERDGQGVLHITSSYCFAGWRGGSVAMAFVSIQWLFS